MSQSQINEKGRAVPTTNLSCDSIGRGDLASLHPSPLPTIPTTYHTLPEPGVRTDSEVTITARELSLPPPAATLGRAGPAPHLGNTVQPTLLVKVWVNQTQTEM